MANTRLDGIGTNEQDIVSLPRYVSRPKRLAEETPSMGWSHEADPTMRKRIAMLALFLVAVAAVFFGGMLLGGAIW